MDITLLQYFLNKKFNCALEIDGDMGPATYAVIKDKLKIQQPWSYDRLAIAAIQTIAEMESIEAGEIDGLMGPQTRFAIKQLEALKDSNKIEEPWRDEEPIYITGNDWPLQTTQELTKYFGPVGTNQTKLQLPHPVRIAWDLNKTVNSITCHEKVADSIERALNKVLDHYNPDQYKSLGLDIFGGSLNVRKIRGGNRYSTHAWGIAIDWDPERNQLKWNKSKANFSKEIYTKWWEIWEEEDWLSLGRAKDFDWMHVQACRIK